MSIFLGREIHKVYDNGGRSDRQTESKSSSVTGEIEELKIESTTNLSQSVSLAASRHHEVSGSREQGAHLAPTITFLRASM